MPYDARLHQKGGFSKSPATTESELGEAEMATGQKKKGEQKRESREKGRTGKGIVAIVGVARIGVPRTEWLVVWRQSFKPDKPHF